MKLKTTLIAIVLGALSGSLAATAHAAAKKEEMVNFIDPSDRTAVAGEFTCKQMRLADAPHIRPRMPESESKALFKEHEPADRRDFTLKISPLYVIMRPKGAARGMSLTARQVGVRDGRYTDASRELHTLKFKGEVVFFYLNSATGEFRMMLECAGKDDF